VLFLGWLAIDVAVNGPQARRVEADLAKELEALAAPPGASLVHQSTSSKPRQARAGRSYHTALGQADLGAYYDQKLKERGWHTCSRRPPTNGGDDLVSFYYCNGAYTAILDYAIQKDRGWDYAVELSWGVTP
jgi:hypothetical protein